MHLKIRGQDTSDIAEVWLEPSDDGVKLCYVGPQEDRDGSYWSIVTLTNDGLLRLHGALDGGIGLQLNKNSAIKVGKPL